MKLNIPNLPKKASKTTPRLRIGRSSIQLNAEAAKALAWKEGDKIMIAEDEHSPGDWYVFLWENGIPLCRSKKSGDLGFCRVALWQLISNKLGFTGSQTFQLAANAPIHHNGTILYAIITAPLLKAQYEAKTRQLLSEADQRTAQRLTA